MKNVLRDIKMNLENKFTKNEQPVLEAIKEIFEKHLSDWRADKNKMNFESYIENVLKNIDCILLQLNKENEANNAQKSS